MSHQVFGPGGLRGAAGEPGVVERDAAIFAEDARASRVARAKPVKLSAPLTDQAECYPGRRNSSTLDKLVVLCFRHLADHARIRVQSPFAALDISEPEPDLAIVPLGDYEKEHPSSADLIIEVAESSLSYDRGPKLKVYAECGVSEYWIVDLVDRRIEVHRKPDGGRYWQVQHHDETSVVRSERYPDLELRVADVLPAK